MDHLGDLGQSPMARRELTIGTDRPGDQKHDAGSKLLTTGTEEVLSRSLKNRMTGTDQGAQISQEGVKVGFDRLEEFCDRCHETQPVP
jgi:hypothetical protein